MTLTSIPALLILFLTVVVMTLACQSDRDIGLELIESRVSESNESHDSLISTLTTMGKRLDAIEQQVDTLTEQGEGLPDQMSTNDKTMRTFIRSEIQGQLGIVEQRFNDLSNQVNEIETELTTEASTLPRWNEGATIEEAKAEFTSCVTVRISPLLGSLVGFEAFTDADIRELAEDLPGDVSDIDAIRLMGILFACWQ